MLRLTCFLLLFFLCTAPASAQRQAQRIVSMNLCTDQLLLLLVDKNRIASLSYFATDPAWSWLADKAAGIPANRGQVEEVLAYNPDLILTSQFSATLAANLLERLGHPVERFGFAATADEMYAQIRRVGALTGTQRAAEKLIADNQAEIADAIAGLRPQLNGKSAVFYAGNGFSYGSASLQDHFLRSLGLRNITADAGLSGPAPLSLEVLVAAAPDFLFSNRASTLDAQLAHPMLRHPALAALTDTRRLELPEDLFQCAGPRLAHAYRQLAAQLADAR